MADKAEEEPSSTSRLSVLEGLLAGGGGDELLLHVFSFLSFRDVCRLAATCRRFAVVASDASLWRSFCLARLLRPFTSTVSSSSGPSSSLTSPDALVWSFLDHHVGTSSGSINNAGSGQWTWQDVFRKRLWLIPQARSLVPEPDDPRRLLFEEILRPPYLLAAALAARGSNASSSAWTDGLASWLLELAVYAGGPSLAESFVKSMVSTYVWLRLRNQTTDKKPIPSEMNQVTPALPNEKAPMYFLSTETVSKLLTRYYHMVGDSYLHKLLSKVIIDIGTRTKKRHKAQKQRAAQRTLFFHTNQEEAAALAEDADAILQKLVTNVDLIPSPLRRVCRHINAEMTEAFTGASGWNFVRLSFFYRFVFPSIIDSSQYDVFSAEVKDPELRNYLVMVTKVLHSISQQAQEDTKDVAAIEPPTDETTSTRAYQMNMFIKQLLQEETETDVIHAVEKQDGQETRVKAREALDQLSAFIKHTKPSINALEEMSSFEYSNEMTALLERVSGLEGLALKPNVQQDEGKKSCLLS